MQCFSISHLTVVEPGAKERIQEKLKDIPQINRERPCINCVHYYQTRMVHCALASGHCDFHHSAYEPINKKPRTRRKQKLEESSHEQS